MVKAFKKLPPHPECPHQPEEQYRPAMGSASGKAAALVLPFVSTTSVRLLIEEISRYVARDVHAVEMLDRAGWHTTSQMKLPWDVSPIFPRSRAPALNPVENIWQFVRANWLSNTAFDGIDHILDAACFAWNNLVALPDSIRSFSLRKWDHAGQKL